jgi:hypothetical protein
MPKTTYVVEEDRMSFILPDRTRHQVLARKVDHPKSMGEALDLLTALTPYERLAVVAMATEYEMKSMYPNNEE